MPLGRIRKSFAVQEDELLCNYFLRAAGELACPSGHGWVITGRHQRSNQPRAGDLANATTAELVTSQARGSGTCIRVGLPSWPPLKGAPDTAEQVCGWMGIVLSTGQLRLEVVLPVVSRTSSAPFP